MGTPTVQRPGLTPPKRHRFLPQTRPGWWALGLQVLAVILAICWPPLGRALGNLHWGAWGLVLPIAVAGLVIGSGVFAIVRAKERSVLLLAMFGLTTTAFVLVGLLLLGFALGKPDINPSQ